MGAVASVVLPVAAVVGALFGGGGRGGGGGPQHSEAELQAQRAQQAQQELARRRQELEDREQQAQQERERQRAEHERQLREFEEARRRFEAEQARRDQEQQRQHEAQRRQLEEQFQQQQEQLAAQRRQQEQERQQFETQKAELLKREEQERKKREAHEARIAEEKQRLKAVGMDNVTNYNVAFVGYSGVGKSTLINCLRGLKPTDGGAARVNTGVECTQQSAKFVFPQIPFLAFWDVPGGATDSHPAATYCRDKCLDLFDALVLCWTGRWSQLCTDIARYAAKHNRKLLLVHTNFRNEISKEYQATTGMPADYASVGDLQVAEGNLRGKINNMVGAKLQELGLPANTAQCLFVESYSILHDGPLNARYDGARLVDAIVRCMAPRHPQGLSAEELSHRFRATFAAAK